jgi:ribosomal protein S18 acetylase RimI-like enzyme
MEQVVVRKAGLEDIESIQAMLSQIDRYHSDLLPAVFRPVEGARPDDLIESLIREEGSDCFLAMVGAEVVGFLDIKELATPDFPLFIPSKYALIDNMVVDEDHRGRGIGRLLMERAKAWAGGKGLDRIQLTVWSENESAIRFYRGQGFRTVIERMEVQL